MDVLLLCYRDEPLREFPLRDHPLEVGRGAGCDIVVHDPRVGERHLLVFERRGTVFVHELGEGGPAEARPLPPNEPLPLGLHHSLVRLPDAPTQPRAIARGTEPLAQLGASRSMEMSLVVGRGSEARRVALRGTPLTIGAFRPMTLPVCRRGWNGTASSSAKASATSSSGST